MAPHQQGGDVPETFQDRVQENRMLLLQIKEDSRA